MKSTSDALRMIKQGAVKIGGERVENSRQVITSVSKHVVQVGKRRFARVGIV